MKRSFRLILSVLSGILLSLPWLGYPGWILFFAFIPLLYIDKFFVEQKKKYQSIFFWRYAFLTTLVWNVLATYWVANITCVGAFVAILVNTFLMSLVLWLAHWFRRVYKTNLGYLALIIFWISFEYLHYHWDFEWPWLHTGSQLASNVKMIQWYEFTGVFGGTFWILLMNILLFKILIKLKKKNFAEDFLYPLLLFLILLIVPFLISYFMYTSYEEEDNPKHIVIVQPNIDPFTESYSLDAEYEKLYDFIRLAKSKTDDSTDYIVGPETVFENQWYWDEDKLQSNQFFLLLADLLTQYSNAEMIFGVSSFKKYQNKQVATPTARIKGDTIYDRFNTAMFIDRDGKEQIYHKSKLVAGVEKMPFYKYLRLTNDMVFSLGGTSGTLGSQEAPSNFTSKDGTKVAPVICFESAFGEYLTKYVNKGAELFVIITNDGWSKNAPPGYKQHLLLARLRAIETRRSIARSANTGISCLINQRGDVLESTKWWTKTSIKGIINANTEVTFYTKHGDYFARISSFLSVLLVLTLLVERKLGN